MIRQTLSPVDFTLVAEQPVATSHVLYWTITLLTLHRIKYMWLIPKRFVEVLLYKHIRPRQTAISYMNLNHLSMYEITISYEIWHPFSMHHSCSPQARLMIASNLQWVHAILSSGAKLTVCHIHVLQLAILVVDQVVLPLTNTIVSSSHVPSHIICTCPCTLLLLDLGISSKMLAAKLYFDECRFSIWGPFAVQVCDYTNSVVSSFRPVTIQNNACITSVRFAPINAPSLLWWS